MATFKKFNEVPSHNSVNDTESFILTDENGNVFRVSKQDMFKAIRNNTFADQKNINGVYFGQWWRVLRVQTSGLDASCSFSLIVTERGTSNSQIIHGFIFKSGYSNERILDIIKSSTLGDKLIEEMSVSNESDGSQSEVFFKTAKEVHGVLQIYVRSHDAWNFESDISSTAIAESVANGSGAVVVNM